MIKPSEIQKKAYESGVRDQQIEKDYILSWILQGIAKHEIISKLLVFKGGTALKKIYFEDYRFSEDLDFTLLDTAITNKEIFNWFKEIFVFIRDEANIPLEIIDKNEHEDGGINFYISYVGPLGGKASKKKVKVDISRDEKLAFNAVKNGMIKSFSDLSHNQLLCYTLEEILVEKLRSVMQRMQARDFYDIWYLLENHGIEVGFYVEEFHEKCHHKQINPADFHKKLKQRLPQYKGRWQQSLADQIMGLPDFDQVEREVKRHLKKLN